MRFLLAISSMIDRLNRTVGRTVAWLTLVVVLVSAINAIIRKTFNVSSNAWLALQWYLFGAIFLLSSSSEEHTSELQSRGRLVCRLRPEKKDTAARRRT